MISSLRAALVGTIIATIVNGWFNAVIATVEVRPSSTPSKCNAGCPLTPEATNVGRAAGVTWAIVNPPSSKGTEATAAPFVRPRFGLILWMSPVTGGPRPGVDTRPLAVRDWDVVRVTAPEKVANVEPAAVSVAPETRETIPAVERMPTVVRAVVLVRDTAAAKVWLAVGERLAVAVRLTAPGVDTTPSVVSVAVAERETAPWYVVPPPAGLIRKAAPKLPVAVVESVEVRTPVATPEVSELS
jgi:hypothetical protein